MTVRWRSREVFGAVRQLAYTHPARADRIEDLIWSYWARGTTAGNAGSTRRMPSAALDAHSRHRQARRLREHDDGLDSGAEPGWKQVRAVRGPFTRFY